MKLLKQIKSKKKVLATSVAILISVLSFNSSAYAVWPVTNYTLDPYLMGFTTGNGLIETLVSMNDKLSQANATNNENQKNQVLANANQAIQEQNMKNIMNRIPDANACSEVTSSGGRGSASSNTSATKAALSDESVKMFTDAQPDLIETKANIYERPDLNVCSADDVKYSRGGCSSEGQYPDQDKSAGTLTNPPLTKQDAAANKVNNQSYNAAQLTIANTVKKNLMGNIPIDQLNDKNLENSKEGREFLSAFTSYVTRSTAGTNAIDSILAMKKASNISVNSRGANIGSSLGSTKGAAQSWNDDSVQKKYKTLFPGAEFPPQPSEWEMLRYEIYSRYADTTGSKAWQVQISTADEKETLHEIARMQAIQLRLTMLQIERQEDANVIAAAQLGQQLQPVDKSLLQQLKNNAQQTSK
jgi:hypothetical protein